MTSHASGYADEHPPRGGQTEVLRARMRRCATVRIPPLTHRGSARREDDARAEGRAEARAENRIERKEDERAAGRDAGRTAVRERPVVADQTPTEKLRPVDRVETRREPEPVPEP